MSDDTAKLLRVIARTPSAKELKHDIIFNTAADRLDILDEISYALESRGYAHCCNGRDIGRLLDDLEEKTLNFAEPLDD